MTTGAVDTRLSHRQRQAVKAQVRAEEPACHLCGYPIDLTRDRYRDPLGSVCDELITRNDGGSPLDRANVRHAHRLCNGKRGKRDITAQLRTDCRAEVAALIGAPRTDTSRRY